MKLYMSTTSPTLIFNFIALKVRIYSTCGFLSWVEFFWYCPLKLNDQTFYDFYYNVLFLLSSENYPTITMR